MLQYFPAIEIHRSLAHETIHAVSFPDGVDHQGVFKDIATRLYAEYPTLGDDPALWGDRPLTGWLLVGGPSFT